MYEKWPPPVLEKKIGRFQKGFMEFLRRNYRDGYTVPKSELVNILLEDNANAKSKETLAWVPFQYYKDWYTLLQSICALKNIEGQNIFCAAFITLTTV